MTEQQPRNVFCLCCNEPDKQPSYNKAHITLQPLTALSFNSNGLVGQLAWTFAGFVALWNDKESEIPQNNMHFALCSFIFVPNEKCHIVLQVPHHPHGTTDSSTRRRLNRCCCNTTLLMECLHHHNNLLRSEILSDSCPKGGCLRQIQLPQSAKQ